MKLTKICHQNGARIYRERESESERESENVICLFGLFQDKNTIVTTASSWCVCGKPKYTHGPSVENNSLGVL